MIDSCPVSRGQERGLCPEPEQDQRPGGDAPTHRGPGLQEGQCGGPGVSVPVPGMSVLGSNLGPVGLPAQGSRLHYEYCIFKVLRLPSLGWHSCIIASLDLTNLKPFYQFLTFFLSSICKHRNRLMTLV